MRSIQSSKVSWSVPDNRGASLFSRKGALTHHLRSKRWYACGIVRSPRGMSLSAESDRQCHSICGCCCHRLRDWANTVASTDAIFQPPAQTCHRQLCRRNGQAFSPSIFSFTKEKQQKENEVNKQWQFTIWKRRWSAGVRDAPLWPPPLT